VGWSIVSCDFSRDKQWLIYSSWSDRSKSNPKPAKLSVHFCNTTGDHHTHETLSILPQSSHRFCLFSIQFSYNSKEILAGSSDQNLYVYDIEKKVRTCKVGLLLATVLSRRFTATLQMLMRWLGQIKKTPLFLAGAMMG
jgi:WD repeat-containing protein 23